MKTIKYIIAFLSLIFIASCSKSTNTETVCKVENINGVPRITIDGTPVRARMLYVSPTHFIPVRPDPATITDKWTQSTIVIPKQKENIDKPLINISGETTECTYWISQFEIREKDTNKKVFELDFSSDKVDPRIAYWCKGVDRRIKNLPIVMKMEKVDGKNALRFEITKESPHLDGIHLYARATKLEANKEYVVNFCVKTEGKKPRMFTCTINDKRNGIRRIAPLYKSHIEPQVRIARDAQVDIVTFPVQASDFYVKEGEKPDYTYLENTLKAVVENNPNAKILVRIRFYPSQKWLQENPDSTLTFDNGTKSTTFPSMSSLKFRKESQEVLRKIIDYSEKHYGKNIIGYHPGGGNSCEWFYPNSHGPTFSGYDASTQQAWNRWLTKKYSSDADLQKAWGIANAKRATDKVPTKQEREAGTWLFDPQTNRRNVDFLDFWNEEMYDMIMCLADVIREKVPNKLCVFFYGYCGDLAAGYNGFANSGHAKLGKILKSNKIDAYCGPISYFDRCHGQGKTTQGATETIKRAGKLWIDEDDTSTYLAPKRSKYPGSEANLDTQEKTIKVLTRNMAHQAVRNIGSWWMDLGGSGWFEDPKLWELKKIFKDAEQDIIKNGLQYKNDIALTFDEESTFYCTAKARSRWATREGFSYLRGSLNRTGITFGHYLLDDLLFGKPTVETKLDIYGVAFTLSKKQRDAIKERAQKNVSVFVWASGYIDLDKKKFSLEAIEDLTGFKMEQVQNGKILPKLYSTELGLKIGMPKEFTIPANKAFPDPLFSPKLEAGDKVYATLPNGKPAFVLRGKTLYCAFAPIPQELFREIAKLAGIHLYTDITSAVYSNGKYISLTPTDIPYGETRTMNFSIPENKEIFDVVTGEKLGVKSFSKKVKKGDSFFLKVGK